MDHRSLLSFPDPVNETSARLVAAGVVAQVALFAWLRERWVLIPLGYGFVARVLAGPTFSPLGQLVTRVLTPQVERRVTRPSRFVPGPPKRFAQAIGVVFSGTAAVTWLLGAAPVTVVVLGLLAAAASLEAFLGICLGCIAHNAVWGCADCHDIGDRLGAAAVETNRTVEAPAESRVAAGS